PRSAERRPVDRKTWLTASFCPLDVFLGWVGCATALRAADTTVVAPDLDVADGRVGPPRGRHHGCCPGSRRRCQLPRLSGAPCRAMGEESEVARGVGRGGM